MTVVLPDVLGVDLVAASTARPASDGVTVNPIYAETMKRNWVQVIHGVATYRGPTPPPGTVFAKLPSVVEFVLGLDNPASYTDCENPERADIDGRHPTTIVPDAQKRTSVQVTVRPEAVFLPSILGAANELRFDAIAARAPTYGDPATPALVR